MRNTITTWANGYGTWHAKVELGQARPSDLLDIDNIRRVARRAIRREVEARNKVGKNYEFRLDIKETDLKADNRIYSVTFKEMEIS